MNLPNCLDYVISPQANYLATFEKFSSASASDSTQPQQQCMNYSLWRIKLKEQKLEKLISFSHKNQATWTPQWSSDESIFARMVTGEVHLYEREEFEVRKVVVPKHKILLDSVSDFALSPPTSKEIKCAVFAKESSDRPGCVRIYTLPDLSAPTAQKNFFKADRCRLLWSPNGRNLLAMASTEVDKTGKSYYGESNLYFLAADGKFDCRVDLGKSSGPIHDFTWSPLSSEFIVIHGFMPATTSLFDLKCTALYTFACGSKNEVSYNAAGNLICFGGFGNLPGTVEIWRRAGAVGRVGAMQATGTTVFSWSPDGSLLLTAVLTPRLRVDNGFKIWSMTGELLHHSQYSELYQVGWTPNDSTRFAAPKIDETSASASGGVKTSLSSNPTAELKKEAYRPPSLRNKTPSPIVSTKQAAAVPPQPRLPTSLPASISKEMRTVRRIQEKLSSIQTIKAKASAGEKLEPEQIEKMAREAEIQKELDAALLALKLSQ